ncbi:MAG: hypothetical protein [Caudoviricetes sp.]|nr:MAG: hypothetical protein [Caudoviricetes sp.]
MSVTVNLDEIIKKLPTEKEARLAASRAINRASQSSRTQATKEVRKDYIIKAGRVNSIAKVRRSNSSNLEAEVNWSGEMIPLHEFRVKPKKQNNSKRRRPQVQAQISKKSGYATYKGTYIGSSGFVWKRKTVKRLPVRAILGPAVAHLLNADAVKQRIMDRAEEILDKRLEHEINRMLSK